MAMRFMSSIWMRWSFSIFIVLNLGGCDLGLNLGDGAQRATLNFGEGDYRWLLISTSDFKEAGKFVAIDLNQGRVMTDSIAIHQDAVVRAFPDQGLFYIINRLGGDNVQTVSQESYQVLHQRQWVGRGANYQDLWMSSASLGYLTTQEQPDLYKVSTSAATPDRAISLQGLVDRSGLSVLDEDGSAELGSMIFAGNRLWIQASRLNRAARYQPRSASMVLLFNVFTDEFTDVMRLARTNPSGDFKLGFDSKLYVVESGAYGPPSALDGAVEKWDPNRQVSEGIVVDERQLQADIIDFERISQSEALMILAYPMPGGLLRTDLAVVDTNAGRVDRVLKSSDSFDFVNIRSDYRRGLAFVTDGNIRNPGVDVVDLRSLQLRSELRITLPLPPYQMVLSR